MNTDKRAIRIWLDCFNYLRSSDFVVDHYPDDDSSRPNVDAICKSSSGDLMAVEHTLIQAFLGEKTDNDRFERVLGQLDKHPSLLESGVFVNVSIDVAAIPKGVDWKSAQRELLAFLQERLRGLTMGSHKLAFSAAGLGLDLRIDKRPRPVTQPGLFTVSRRWPNLPNEPVVRKAFDDKLPKLARANAARKILLLEQDTVAGDVPSDVHTFMAANAIESSLMPDEIWWLMTAALETEQYAHAQILLPKVGEEMADWSNGNVTSNYP